jgi:hypothetical protein
MNKNKVAYQTQNYFDSILIHCRLMVGVQYRDQ